MNVEVNGIKWRAKNGKVANGDMQNRLEVWLPGATKAAYLPLGFNLTPELHAMRVREVLQDQALKAKLPALKGQAGSLADLWAGYVAEVVNDKKREPHPQDKSRFENAVLRILGHLPLEEVNDRKYGLHYIKTRREEGIADGTIAREYAILNAVMRVAEKNEVVTRNRFRDVKIPKCGERKIAVPVSILLEILPYCTRQLQRAVIVALNTLQRQEKVWEIQRAGIFKHEDPTIGLMLKLGKPKTAGLGDVIGKDNLEEMPLNKWAYMALTEDGVRQIHGTGRVFTHWYSSATLSLVFVKASKRAKAHSAVYREWCERKGIDHVVFHDLRKSGRTALTDYKAYSIEHATGEVLLGHSLGKVEGLYQASWDWKLKQAVDALEDTYRPLAAYMGYEGAHAVRTSQVAAAV